jgi:hypothetical protein
VAFLQALGLFVVFPGTLMASWAIAYRLTRKLGPALLVVLLLGTQFTFSAYATGGLETQAQSLFVAIALLLGLRAWSAEGRRKANLVALSLVGGLGFLTRMDTAVLLAPLGLGLFYRLGTEGTGRRERAALLAYLLVPGAMICFTWLGWKLAYYGTVLPNTYEVKVGGGASLVHGFWYTAEYFCSYNLVFLPFLLAFAWRRMVAATPFGAGVVVATVVLWLAYIIRVGGDFMEFRLLVPIAPLLSILVVWGVECLGSSWAKLALLGAAFVGNFRHPATFEFHPRFRVETVRMLANHIDSPVEDWDGIGRALGSVFPPPSDVTIATTAAGAIPFYSGLRTVDMLGLNDTHVARFGTVLGDRPGHQRIATLDYLEEQRVNLLIGHPVVRDATFLTADLADYDFEAVTTGMWDWFDLPRERAPEHAALVAIPINDRHVLLAIYLRPHTEIDRAIRAHRWKTWPVAATATRDAVTVEAFDAFRRPPFTSTIHRNTSLGLGQILYQWGRLEDAERLFGWVVDDRGNGDEQDRQLNSWGHIWLGTIAERRGDRASAEAHFQRALDAEPNNGAAHAALGWLLIEDGRCDDAVPVLHQALTVAPGHQGAAEGLILCGIP